MSSERTLPGGIALSGGAPYADPNWHLWMNANLLKLSTLFTLRVLSRVTSLPVSPSDGDIYIVPDGDANEKTVAVRDNGTWTYISAFAGLMAYVIDEDADYAFDGTDWMPDAGGGTSGPFTLTENAQTGTTYTFVLTDADNKVVSGNNVSATTFTVPPNSATPFGIGSVINIRQKGTGQISVANGVGVTINYPATASLKLREQESWATLVKTDTDSWSLFGDLEGAPGTAGSAAEVSYDNATSGLTAADVQAAIDEIVASLGTAAGQDYEEGTWTPVITFSTPGDLAIVYSTQEGKYSKMGNAYFVEGVIITSSFTYTTASGTLLISGLPAVNTTNISPVVPVGYHHSSFTYGSGNTMVECLVREGFGDMLFRLLGSGATPTAATTTNQASGTTPIFAFSGDYLAA